MSRTACIVQGDFRRGTLEVLESLEGLFDLIIVSTWKDDIGKFPEGRYEIIGLDKPSNYGITNRNLQRLGTAEGLRRAKERNCDFVLKWRTDLLPSKLNVDHLIRLAKSNVPYGVDSRIVTCAFRNLTVSPDEFSSVPDLFAFGSIQMLTMLWDDSDFDYSLPLNLPKRMIEKYGADFVTRIDEHNYCAETELYAFLKYRLEAHQKLELCHQKIAENYLHLIDDEDLGILWFGRDKSFRSIKQAYHIPWWKIKNGKPYQPAVMQQGYLVKGLVPFLKGKIGNLIVKKNILKQRLLYLKHKASLKKSK